MDWAAIDDEQLERAFGPATLARGRSYADDGRVAQVQVSGAQ